MRERTLAVGVVLGLLRLRRRRSGRRSCGRRSGARFGPGGWRRASTGGCESCRTRRLIGPSRAGPPRRRPPRGAIVSPRAVGYAPARRCSFPTALAIDSLKTPLPAWLHADEATGGVQALVRSIDALVVEPLKTARDDVMWAEALDRALPTWMGLRVALAQAGIQALGVETLEAASREVADLPLTLLPEPAHGAAVYAIDLLAWLGEQTLAAVRRRERFDVVALQSLIEDVAVIELCWLTLVGPERPAPVVAEAAAWDAYSRARPLRSRLRRIGFDPAGLPVETPDEAVARGVALVDAVASGWTDADREAVESARIREPISP